MFAANKYIFLQTDDKIFTLGRSAAPRHAIIILLPMAFFLLLFSTVIK